MVYFTRASELGPIYYGIGQGTSGKKPLVDCSPLKRADKPYLLSLTGNAWPQCQDVANRTLHYPVLLGSICVGKSMGLIGPHVRAARGIEVAGLQLNVNLPKGCNVVPLWAGSL